MYSVYSLLNDTIIITNYFSDGAKNLTSVQRKAVDKVAFATESRWLD